MAGKLIVIEGTDGSGKATQTELLYQALLKDGAHVCKTSFPNYDSPSSALVKMYLGGEFGNRPEDVNAYAASIFYAVDRYASYKTSPWGTFYNNGGIVLSDRYTISNAIHQGGKLPAGEKEAYLGWLYEFEYQKIGIPKPDLVFFLDMPTDIAAKLRKNREAATNTKADIHEQDLAYLAQCRENARNIAAASGWVTISCAANNEVRSIEDIHTEIYAKTLEFLKGV